jgi:hypothetical protein
MKRKENKKSIMCRDIDCFDTNLIYINYKINDKEVKVSQRELVPNEKGESGHIMFHLKCDGDDKILYEYKVNCNFVTELEQSYFLIFFDDRIDLIKFDSKTKMNVSKSFIVSYNSYNKFRIIDNMLIILQDYDIIAVYKLK